MPNNIEGLGIIIALVPAIGLFIGLIGYMVSGRKGSKVNDTTIIINTEKPIDTPMKNTDQRSLESKFDNRTTHIFRPWYSNFTGED